MAAFSRCGETNTTFYPNRLCLISLKDCKSEVWFKICCQKKKFRMQKISLPILMIFHWGTYKWCLSAENPFNTPKSIGKKKWFADSKLLFIIFFFSIPFFLLLASFFSFHSSFFPVVVAVFFPVLRGQRTTATRRWWRHWSCPTQPVRVLCLVLRRQIWRFHVVAQS